MSIEMVKIRRALISVTDKAGVVDLAKALVELGAEIISTGGTATKIKGAGISVMEIGEVTGFPEMLDGRVKTLHPKVHGGLLARRDLDSHLKTIEGHGINPIDMVVVNLYPFRETIAKEGVTLEDAIENIDIGGPAMIRSASKNFEGVVVLVDPSDYPIILSEIKANGGVSRETRYHLAAKAFRHTAAYDGAIATYLSATSIDGVREDFPPFLFQAMNRAYPTSYGENPHQRAAFYVDPAAPAASLAKAVHLQDAEVSFNNMLDLEAALRLLLEFDEMAVCLVKHTNPCGVATSEKSLADAFRKARDLAPSMVERTVVGVNRKVDLETAKEIFAISPDAIIAVGYDNDALNLLAKNSSMPILQVDMSQVMLRGYDYKTLTGGLLVEELDVEGMDMKQAETATRRKATDDELKSLRFAWICVKHIRSIALCLAREDSLVAVGAGQLCRKDAMKLISTKAGDKAKGSAMASDGYIEEVEVIEEAARLGVTAIVQPGGGPDDDKIVEACNNHKIAMLFTGIRHFRH